jgi:hypothetical protein
MRNTGLRRLGAAALGAATIGLMGLSAPSQAVVVEGDTSCYVVDEDGHSDAARGGWGNDTRDVSAEQQRAIDRRTDRILRVNGKPTATAVSVPVYVHVMAATDGTGDVTDQQITQQIAVLNNTFAGNEDSTAAHTSFSFTLAGVDRFYNNTWHRTGRRPSTAARPGRAVPTH